MGFVQKLRCQVQMNRKVGFVGKLRVKVMETRNEERKVQEYLRCMDMYKLIAESPFNYTFDNILEAEDVLDCMIFEAVADQRKHRKYAKDALRQMQALQK
jgi:hypothetical protein